jgi:hypothetical protein
MGRLRARLLGRECLIVQELSPSLGRHRSSGDSRRTQTFEQLVAQGDF